MPSITLPDGSQRDYDQPVSIYDVAHDIGPGLAKAALGGHIDGVLSDTSAVISEDAALSIVTSRDEDGVHLIRHSTCLLYTSPSPRD